MHDVLLFNLHFKLRLIDESSLMINSREAMHILWKLVIGHGSKSLTDSQTFRGWISPATHPTTEE